MTEKGTIMKHFIKQNTNQDNYPNNFFRAVCGLAIPVTLQSLIQSSFSVVDQLMIGQMGSVSIAGVGLAGKFLSVFNVLAAAVAAVEGIMVAQYMGKKDKQGVNRSFSVSMVLSVILTLLFSGACFLFPEQIMSLYTRDPASRLAAAGYLRITGACFFFSAGTQLLSTLLRCMEEAVLPLYASFAAMVLNTILNYLLIFGKFGLPALGIIGAALATVTSQMINFRVLLLLFWKQSRKTGTVIHFDLHLGKEGWHNYALILIPMLITEFFWVLGENVYGIIYGHMGTADCAAMTLTNPLQGVLIGMLSGVSQAAGILIGKRLGSGEYQPAYKEAKKLMLYGLCGSVLLSIVLFIFRQTYVNLYQVEAEVKQTTIQVLAVYAVICNVKVQNMILGGGIIRSGGKTKYVMAIDLIGTWMFGVPLSLLSAFVWNLSLPWVYFMLSLEECVRLAISLVVFRGKKWMRSL